MATNTILNSSVITREALRILHQKLQFIGNINRQYDDSYAQSGAKIGDTLKIRMPNQFTVRTGANLSAQNTVETNTSLQIATQKGVDVSFSSAELTLSLDDFSKRILEPAMSVLAANIEADAMNMYKDVYNVVDNDTAALSFLNIMQGRQILNDELTPMDSNRSALLSSAHTVKFIDAVKGLYNDSGAISKQYKEGLIGRTGGFDFYESSLVADKLTGTSAKTTGYAVNGASQTGSSVTVKTGANTFKAGDIVTFAGCNRVHPETKADTGALQKFVVTEDYAGGAGNLKISPSIVTSGAYQNVSASPTDSGAVVKLCAGASEYMNSSMLFHKDAFAFATADLVMPKGVDFAARESFDGLSLRVVRQYSISDDTYPCRIDILYGYKTIRPQLACRIHADG